MTWSRTKLRLGIVIATFGASLLATQAYSADASENNAIFACYPPMQDLLSDKENISSFDLLKDYTSIIDSTLENLSHVETIDSISVSLFTPAGSPLYEKSVGILKANDTTSTAEPDAESLYRIARDIEALDLDSDISKYIEDFDYPSHSWRKSLGLKQNGNNNNDDGQEYSGEKITPRQLISQTSGTLRDMFINQASPLQSPNSTSEFLIPSSRQDVLSTIKDNPPVNSPEVYPSYSNLGFILAGYVIEGVYKKNLGQELSYEEIIQQDILDPLGMKSTYFTVPEDKVESVAVPSGPGASWSDKDLTASNAAFGISSNMKDLQKLGQYLLSHYHPSSAAASSSDKDKDDFIVHSSTIREWFKPRYSFQDSMVSVGWPWEIFKYEYQEKPGSSVLNSRPLTVYTKAGTLSGFHSYLIMDPDRQFGATILFTGEPADLLYILEQFSTMAASALDSARNAVLTPQSGKYCLVGNSTSDGTEEGVVQLDIVQESLWITNWTYMGQDMMELLQMNVIIDNEATSRFGLWPTSEKGIFRAGTGRPPINHFEGCQMQWLNFGSLTTNDYPLDLMALEDDKLYYPSSGMLYQKC